MDKNTFTLKEVLEMGPRIQIAFRLICKWCWSKLQSAQDKICKNCGGAV